MQPAEYCFLWLSWEWACMPRSEWASWAQAIGAVASIWAAWKLATRQYRQAQRDARAQVEAERHRFVASITDVLEFSLVTFERVMDLQDATDYEFLNYKSDGQAYSLRRDAFAVNSYITALGRFDGTRLRDSTLSQHLLLATFALDVLRDHLVLVKESDSPNAMETIYIFGPISGAFDALRLARNKFVDTVFGVPGLTQG